MRNTYLLLSELNLVLLAKKAMEYVLVVIVHFLMSSSVGDNYKRTEARVHELSQSATLVAVSKTKPIELLQECFNAGCRVFGENYVDEIITKAPQLPEASFHMIGHLQSNKVSKLCKMPNLVMIQTIDSIELANKVNNACANREKPLLVCIQVNTSQEPQKCGIMKGDGLFALAHHIKENCPHLELDGLMTIGELGKSARDFQHLMEVRTEVATNLGVAPETIKLSMGMSADYELALQMGASYVRVGSSIFGAREYKHA